MPDRPKGFFVKPGSDKINSLSCPPDAGLRGFDTKIFYFPFYSIPETSIFAELLVRLYQIIIIIKKELRCQ